MVLQADSRQEQITITGHLGPIQAIETPLTLSIAPLTVFIGPQGTGKSLISQLLYFFRDAQYLLLKYSKQEGPEVSVRKVIEGIRSGEASPRSFASFVMNNKVSIEYCAGQSVNPGVKGGKAAKPWSVSCYSSNRQIRPTGDFNKVVQQWLTAVSQDPTQSPSLLPKTLFIPAERSFFSRLINSDPNALASADLPLSMREFTSFLFKAADTHEGWHNGMGAHKVVMPTEVQEISDLVTQELRGYARFSKEGRYKRKWQWQPEQSDRAIEIEMASSGQMETWPMVSIAQALFGWEQSQRPLFIHIEEPETHLHPLAQVAITQLLAYLCNKGFRLVITTHSLFVLYVLNNLVLAAQTLPNQPFANLPSPVQRLQPEMLAAYLFAEGTAVSIRDAETGQLDESRLSQVLGDLEVQYNQIQAYDILWR